MCVQITGIEPKCNGFHRLLRPSKVANCVCTLRGSRYGLIRGAQVGPPQCHAQRASYPESRQLHVAAGIKANDMQARTLGASFTTTTAAGQVPADPKHSRQQQQAQL